MSSDREKGAGAEGLAEKTVRGPYWNGETEREKMVRELLESRGRVGMALAVNIILSVAILLLAIAFVWIGAALGATE